MQNEGDVVMVGFQLILYKKLSSLENVATTKVGFGKVPAGTPINVYKQFRTHILPIRRNDTLKVLYKKLDKECGKMVEAHEVNHKSTRSMVGNPVVTFNDAGSIAEIDFDQNLTVSQVVGHEHKMSLTIHRAYPLTSNMTRVIQFLLCTTIAERDDDGKQILRRKAVEDEKKKENEPLKRLLENLDLDSYFSTLSRMHLSLPFMCSLSGQDLRKALEETDLPFGARKRVEWAVNHIRLSMGHPFRNEERHCQNAASKTVEEFDSKATKREQAKPILGREDSMRMEEDNVDMVECRSIFNCDAHFPALHRIAEFMCGSKFGVRTLVGRTGLFESTWTEKRNSALRKKVKGPTGILTRPLYDTVLITPDPFDESITKHYFAIQFANFGTMTVQRSTSIAIGFTNDRYKLTNERPNYMFSGQNVYSKIYTFINTGQRAVVPFKQHGGIAVPSTGFRFAGGTLQPQQRTIQWTQHLVRGDILGFLYDTEKDQCQLFKNGEMMEGVFFRNLSMLHKRGQVYFYVELSIPGDDIHSVRFPRNKEEANELKKELELLPKDEDIAELMKFGAKDVEHAKDILFKAGGEMQRAKEVLNAPAQPAKPTFNFGARARPMFGVSPQTTLPQPKVGFGSKPFKFGAQKPLPKTNLTQPKTQQKIGGIPVKNAAGFKFGGTPSTQPKTQQKIGGIPVKKAGGFTFGATKATNKNPGSVGNTTTNKPAFNFGGSTASTTKPPAFNFGGNSSNAGSADSNQPARKKQKK